MPRPVQALTPVRRREQLADPHLLGQKAAEALRVVRDEGRPNTEVVQEIRRGYLWHGRLFRYAQVRVAKP